MKDQLNKEIITRTDGLRWLLTGTACAALSFSLLGVLSLVVAMTAAFAVVVFVAFLLALSITAYVAYHIHVHSLEGKAREIEGKSKEIMEANRIHLATVEALATAIDARDQLGVGHVRRIQIYAVGMGRLLELSDAEIDALRTGALLHDIGKLAVPDHILNKPGSLSHGEMEKVKIHSSVGASILEKVGFPNPVVPTVKYHHEFWDGTGYPEGLRGSHIPLTARILAVADSFDTLRGERPYRPAVSREEACNFLRAGAGTQFDPKVVDLFLRNLKLFEDEIAEAGLAYDEDSTLQASPSFVEQIKRANREVFSLYSLAREFSASMTLDEALALFSEKIGEFVPYDCCAVYLLEDAGEFANAAHVRGLASEIVAGNRIRVGDGGTGHALETKKPVENVDPALDLEGSEGVPEFRTMVSRPLMVNDRVIGAVTLYSARFAAYQPDHFRLLETVSKIAADAIEKSRRHAEAATHAHTDPITQLPNARRLQMEFDKEVKRSTRTGSSFQLLMLDLDGFKAVNDTFGHKVGDKLLVAIGGVIRKELREYDFLARYAGDEFVAIIPDTDVDEVSELSRRIEKAVTGFGLRVDGRSVARVGVSIGSACYPIQGDSFDQLVISADKAMYLTKALHKQKSKAFEEFAKTPDLGEEYRSEPPQAEEDDAIHISMVPEMLPSGEHVLVEVDEEQIVEAAWQAKEF